MGTVILHFFILLASILLLPSIIYIRRCIRFYRAQPYLLYHPKFNFEVKSRDYSVAYRGINLLTKDGLTLSAWYVPAEERERKQERNVILFCHGNAGNISQRIDTFNILCKLGYDTFIFDYRGYGHSEGRPSEKGTYLDAEAAWGYLVNEMNIEPKNIIVFGRSLGGGIASYLALKYQPRALVIESSYTSIPDVATWRYGSGYLVRRLTRYKYDTRKRLKDIHCPVLIIHGPDDEIIPYAQGKILYETANPPKQFLRLKGMHLYGFIESGNNYIEGLREFFESL
ncbi:MAG: alpha/beta hydrolase [bacterium]|nr:alpha/beta hydrolase [bacterium]